MSQEPQPEFASDPVGIWNNINVNFSRLIVIIMSAKNMMQSKGISFHFIA